MGSTCDRILARCSPAAHVRRKGVQQGLVTRPGGCPRGGDSPSLELGHAKDSLERSTALVV